jgi:hypothetical protein
VVPMMGSDGCLWWESGVSGSVSCLCFWQESGFSCREDVLTFNVHYKKINLTSSMRFAKIMLQ